MESPATPQCISGEGKCSSIVFFLFRICCILSFLTLTLQLDRDLSPILALYATCGSTSISKLIFNFSELLLLLVYCCCANFIVYKYEILYYLWLHWDLLSCLCRIVILLKRIKSGKKRFILTVSNTRRMLGECRSELLLKTFVKITPTDLEAKCLLQGTQTSSLTLLCIG